MGARHLRPLVPISEDELVGIEWWPRIQSAATGVNLHNDRDVVTDSGDGVCPRFSSVLYLGDTGGPTVVLNQTMGAGDVLMPVLPGSGIFVFPEKGFFAVFEG